MMFAAQHRQASRKLRRRRDKALHQHYRMEEVGLCEDGPVLPRKKKHWLWRKKPPHGIRKDDTQSLTEESVGGRPKWTWCRSGALGDVDVFSMNSSISSKLYFCPPVATPVTEPSSNSGEMFHPNTGDDELLQPHNKPPNWIGEMSQSGSLFATDSLKDFGVGSSGFSTNTASYSSNVTEWQTFQEGWADEDTGLLFGETRSAPRVVQKKRLDPEGPHCDSQRNKAERVRLGYRDQAWNFARFDIDSCNESHLSLQMPASEDDGGEGYGYLLSVDEEQRTGPTAPTQRWSASFSEDEWSVPRNLVCSRSEETSTVSFEAAEGKRAKAMLYMEHLEFLRARVQRRDEE